MGVFAGKFDGRSMTALLLSLTLVAPLAAAQDRTEPEYEDHVVVVQFAPDVFIANKSGATGLQEFDRRADRYGVYLIERVYPFLDYVEPTPKTRRNLMALRRTYYVRYHASAAPEQVAGDLAAAPGVTYAEPVGLIRYHGTGAVLAEPDDALFGDQTYLRHMRLPQAWEIVKGEDGNPPVVIAIVDDGGNWRHEDLLSNVWTNPDEIPGNGVDDDDNGFIDDVHGINTLNGDDTDNDPYMPKPNAYHGTLVAGAAGAVTDNGIGLAGAAWNARLMHATGAYTGILYAAANGADIINTSWFRPSRDDEARMEVQVLDLATDMGALVVAAAGNLGRRVDGLAYNPGGHPRVLSVGSTEKDSRIKASFSNYGKTVDVFVPGEGINTTTHSGGYGLSGGTSLSAPLVSGVAALVKTRFPDISPDALREKLRLSGENMDAENPHFAGQLGRGYLNAEAALQESVLPAVRVKRWSWSDADGDSQINSGDNVTINATVVNYLADARQLTVGLAPAESYPYISITTAERTVGRLDSGDSTNVTFRFTVAADAPINRSVRFHTRIRDGTFADESDVFTLNINHRLDIVHAALSALYVSTGGENWTNNRGWDITMIPDLNQLHTWHGVWVIQGWIAFLEVHNNNLTGTLPPELGNLSQLQSLWLQDNALTGMLPRSLMQLTNLAHLRFGGQDLCAPQDDDFQAWLSSIPNVDGPTCAGLQLAGGVENQTFTLGEAIPALVLPEATGGLSPINYTLTPMLPAGLDFDTSTRTISGTPTVVTTAPVPYTYKATDANGSADSLLFNIEVYAPVGVADETLPTSFAVRGNYPNPFRQTTRLVFDLPLPARVTVEVMDVMGRRVLTVPSVDMAAGWEHRIELSGTTLSSGLYLYRLIAASPGGISTHVGRFVRIR